MPELRHISTHRKKEQITHITLERFLSRVRPHVLIQSSFLAEGLVAFAAFIRLLLQRHTYTQLSLTQKKHNSTWKIIPSITCGENLQGKPSNDTRLRAHVEDKQTGRHRKEKNARKCGSILVANKAALAPQFGYRGLNSPCRRKKAANTGAIKNTWFLEKVRKTLSRNCLWTYIRALALCGCVVSILCFHTSSVYPRTFPLCLLERAF